MKRNKVFNCIFIVNSLLFICILFCSKSVLAQKSKNKKQKKSSEKIDSLVNEKIENKIYLYSIESEIFPAAWRKTKRAVEKAEEENCSHIILKLNTYGGLVNIADSIRTKLMNAKPTTIVFIDNNAASAGALISIACDSIYMSKGAQIGAATVVNQTGEKLPDKYQSYMRATMRSTAEVKNRNPKIAEAMVDESIEIEGIIAKDKILTFTTKEAIDNKFCEGEFNSINEIKAHLNISDAETIEYKEDTTEKIISFLLNPAVTSVLLMMIIGGIYFELQTPGVGFPILAAFIGAILYFAPNYIEGLAANWEICLFILGIVFLALEIFAFPGFGFFGVLGIAALITGLTLSLLQNDFFDFTFAPVTDVIGALITVCVPILLLLTLMLFYGQNLLENPIFKRLALQEVQDAKEGYTVEQTNLGEHKGKTGIAYTVLRPSGKVKIDDRIYDAITDGNWIEPNTSIIVEGYKGSYLIVDKA